jgi:hypothetical protein
LVSVQVNEPKPARRRQPPLEHVPVDYQGTAKRSVTLPLVQGSDVDDKRPRRHLTAQFTNPHPLQAKPSVAEKLVDRDMH